MIINIIASTLAPKAPKLVVDERGNVCPLTTCCDATGKGLMDESSYEGYVGCRACYKQVSDYYGMGWQWDDESPFGWLTYGVLAADWEGFSSADAQRIQDELKGKVIDVMAAREVTV